MSTNIPLSFRPELPVYRAALIASVITENLSVVSKKRLKNMINHSVYVNFNCQKLLCEMGKCQSLLLL